MVKGPEEAKENFKNKSENLKKKRKLTKQEIKKYQKQIQQLKKQHKQELMVYLEEVETQEIRRDEEMKKSSDTETLDEQHGFERAEALNHIQVMSKRNELAIKQLEEKMKLE